MRINVYTEELLFDSGPARPRAVEIVHADYVSSRTGEKMRNWGVRIYMKSHPDLHYVPPRDDDRSAVTFWCGPKEKDVIEFLDMVRSAAYACTLDTWREKTEAVQAEAEKSFILREADKIKSAQLRAEAELTPADGIFRREVPSRSESHLGGDRVYKDDSTSRNKVQLALMIHVNQLIEQGISERRAAGMVRLIDLLGRGGRQSEMRE